MTTSQSCQSWDHPSHSFCNEGEPCRSRWTTSEFLTELRSIRQLFADRWIGPDEYNTRMHDLVWKMNQQNGEAR